jgi:hypothetical protein
MTVVVVVFGVFAVPVGVVVLRHLLITKTGSFFVFIMKVFYVFRI